MKNLTILLFSIISIAISCGPKTNPVPAQKEEAVLGDLQHKFVLNEATQESFEEGLLLLHNFEYDDALIAFENATAQDSTEIMTHWGEAMCHYKALWRLQNMEKGKAIMSRIGVTKAERIANISDPLEKDMWGALEIMYGDGEFDDRNKRLSEYMGELHAKRPQHQEIAAFYALSLIWSTDEYGDGSDDLRLAASIADGIIEKNPLHPGALHYKIHALDGPTSAVDAHAAADAYAKVAADAAHALHMPSHIYLALGEWDGVVNSNQVSYAASVERMKKKELKDGARGYHSFAWLHYGLLQQGRYDEATEVLTQMLTHVPNDPTKPARGYLLGMQNRQIVESGDWPNDIELDLNVLSDDIGLVAKSMKSFLNAQVAAQNNDIETIYDEIKWLSKQKEIASTQISGDGIAMCAAGTSRYAPTENAVRSSAVVIAQMKGMIARINGDNDLFENHMITAVNLEEETNYPAGPPRIALPSFEQYGEWLLSEGRYADAYSQFEKALNRMPKRTKSLAGKMKALRGLDRQEEADVVQNELNDIMDKGDENT